MTDQSCNLALPITCLVITSLLAVISYSQARDRIIILLASNIMRDNSLPHILTLSSGPLLPQVCLVFVRVDDGLASDNF